MHGEYKMRGGKLIVADLNIVDGRLRNVSISGDFFLEPDTALDAINAALEGADAWADERALSTLLESALPGVSMYGVSTDAIATAVHRALEAHS